MAEFVLRTELTRAGLDGQVEVDSAGTGDWHLGQPMFGPALAELRRRGYDGRAHRARQIERAWLSRYDLVLAMDRSNLDALRRMSPGAFAEGRVRLLRSFDPDRAAGDPYQDEVPDPYGGGPEDFELVFELVAAAARGLTGQLADFLAQRATGRP